MLQSLLEKLAIADEHVRPAFDQSFQLFASISQDPNDPVDSDQGHCRNHPSDHGIVATVHGVLNGVTQDQKQNQIERRQLADLPLSRQSQQNDQENINNDPAQNEFPPD